MQWTSSPQAGFSTSPQTWLPIPAKYKTINVATEWKDPQSQLNWYERLIALRRSNPALRDGSITMLDTENPDVLCYLRGDSKPVVVAINFSAQPKTVTLHLPGRQLKRLLTDADVTASTTLTLPPYASYMATVQ